MVNFFGGVFVSRVWVLMLLICAGRIFLLLIEEWGEYFSAYAVRKFLRRIVARCPGRCWNITPFDDLTLQIPEDEGFVFAAGYKLLTVRRERECCNRPLVGRNSTRRAAHIPGDNLAGSVSCDGVAGVRRKRDRGDPICWGDPLCLPPDAQNRKQPAPHPPPARSKFLARAAPEHRSMKVPVAKEPDRYCRKNPRSRCAGRATGT